MAEKTKEGGIILTRAEAKNLILVNDGVVHTFFNAPFGLIGGDHSEKSVLEDIERAAILQLAGPEAQNSHHALAILEHTPIAQGDILFVETRDDEVKKILKKVK